MFRNTYKMSEILNDSSIYNTTNGSDGYETAKEDQSQYYSILEEDDTLQNISGISVADCSSATAGCIQETNININKEHLMLAGKSNLGFDILQHADLNVVQGVVTDAEGIDEINSIQNVQNVITSEIHQQAAGQIVQTTEGRIILYKLEGSDDFYAIPVDAGEQITQDDDSANGIVTVDNYQSESEENHNVLIQYGVGNTLIVKSDDDIKDSSEKKSRNTSEGLQVSGHHTGYEETPQENISCDYAYATTENDEMSTSTRCLEIEPTDELKDDQNLSCGDSVELEEYLDEEYLEYETGDGEPVTGDSDVSYNSHVHDSIEESAETRNMCQNILVLKPMETEGFLNSNDNLLETDPHNLPNNKYNQEFCSQNKSTDDADISEINSKVNKKVYSKNLSNNNCSFLEKQISTGVSDISLSGCASNDCDNEESYKYSSHKKSNSIQKKKTFLVVTSVRCNKTEKQTKTTSVTSKVTPLPETIGNHSETSFTNTTCEADIDSINKKSDENITPVKVKPRNRKQVLTVVDRPDGEIIFEPILTPEDQPKEKPTRGRGRKPKMSEEFLISDSSSETEKETIQEKPKRKYTKSNKIQELTVTSPLRFSKRLSKKSKQIKTCRIKSCSCDLQHKSWNESGDSGMDDNHKNIAESSDSNLSDDWSADKITKKIVNKKQQQLQKVDDEKININTKVKNKITCDDKECTISKEKLEDDFLKMSTVEHVKNLNSAQNISKEKITAQALDEIKEYSLLFNKNTDIRSIGDIIEESNDFRGFLPHDSLILAGPCNTEKETLSVESISRLHSIDYENSKSTNGIIAEKVLLNKERENGKLFGTTKSKSFPKELSPAKKRLLMNNKKRNANLVTVAVSHKKTKISNASDKIVKDLKAESFKCKICDKSFRQYTHLLQHKNVHTKVGFAKCEHCLKEFAFQNGLNSHIKRGCPKGKAALGDKVSSKHTETKTDIIDETKTIILSDDSFEGIPFKSVASKLTYRIPNKSPIKSKRTLPVRKSLALSIYKCEQCSIQLKSAMSLERHMKLHNKKTSPPKSISSNSLSRRSMIPSLTSKFPSINKTSALQRRTLAIGKPEKSFITVEHQELKETVPKGDLKEICHVSKSKNICTLSKQLKIEQKTETKGAALKSIISKRLQCVKCSLVFKTQSELARHRSSHLATKTFKCTDCRQAFSSRAQLNDHAGTHRTKKNIGNANEIKRKPKTPGSITKRKPHGGILLNRTLCKRIEELKKKEK